MDYETLVCRHAPEADCRSAECTKIGTEIMLVYARDAEKYGTEAVLATNTPIELHVVQLGGMAIASVAAEVFVEVGLAVKKNVAVCNDHALLPHRWVFTELYLFSLCLRSNVL